MKQYCRYCCNANIVDDDLFYCDVKKRVYKGSTGKRTNECKSFVYNENDVFGMKEDGTFKTYTPRKRRKKMKQILLEEI